jgi:hypothetical protein
MFSKGFALLLACAFVVGCSSDYRAKSIEGYKKPKSKDLKQKSKVKVDYTVLTPEELFAKKFEIVMMECEILDGADVVATIPLRVFPYSTDYSFTSGYDITAKNSKIAITLNRPTLGSLDFKIDDQVAGQTPIVTLTGYLSVKVKDSVELSGEIGGTMFTGWKESMNISGTITAENADPKLTVSTQVKCRFTEVTANKADSN